METDEVIGYGRVLRVKEPKIYHDTRVDDEIEGKRKFSVEEKLRDNKFDQNLSDILIELQGKDFDLKYVQEHGFNTPILFKDKEGLGLKMPNPDLFSVNDVKSYVGARRMVDVFDCDTHQADQMSVYHWVRYYTGSEREKILNVTSLEFSHTGLDRIIECPTIVRNDLDWVPQVWPKNLIAEQKDTTNSIDNMKYPKVKKYVLMSVAGCYTDFHIDFGGTSVWYHVLKGAKVFWLIPPTEINLGIYEKWVLSGRQQDVFFGDLVKDCYRIHLVAGDTFMIPTGWIHGVYTPDDSLVFGGNFLHSFNIPMQLKAYDIEENTHVPKRLRYPFFAEIHWYMIKGYVDILEHDLDERRMMEFESEEDIEDHGAFKLVKEEMNDECKNDISKSRWKCIYLTVYELEGLKLLCERFRTWTYAKLNYPKDLVDDDMELLDRLEELLQYHDDDDQILACQGINIFKQHAVKSKLKGESFPGPVPTSPLNTPLANPLKTTSSPTSEKHSPSSRHFSPSKKDEMKRVEKLKHKKLQQEKENKKKKKKKKKTVIRRVRCQNCDGCSRENCDECKFCLDMPKNGGTGRLRQSCALRFCKDPQLPNYVECNECKQGKHNKAEVLMECSLCLEIVHPNCLKKKSPCKISKKVNNSWECPNCCDAEEGCEFSMDQVGGVVSDVKRKWQESYALTCKEQKGKKPKKESGILKNGHVDKVKNLKSLLKNVKVLKKVSVADALQPKLELTHQKRKSANGATIGKKRKILKKESDVSQDDDSSSSSDDDEPLIKKKQSLQQKKEVVPVSNGNAHSESRDNTLKPLDIHEPKIVVRPAPINVYEKCKLEDASDHVLPRLIWIRVFTYLSTNDKHSCMLICKAWNQWAIDNTLWRTIDVSNKKVNQSMLKGIVRRQPIELDLSNTNANGRQLEWLLRRLPCLQSIDLSLNTATAVSALMRVNCPPLKYLKLAWCTAMYDRFVTQILSPASNNGATSNTKKSRLVDLQILDLTGCNVSDETVHYILTELSCLRHLIINHCCNVTDSSFEALLTKTAACQKTLKTIECSGCAITDATIKMLEGIDVLHG